MIIMMSNNEEMEINFLKVYGAWIFSFFLTLVCIFINIGIVLSDLFWFVLLFVQICLARV
jgi:hypothetical protein